MMRYRPTPAVWPLRLVALAGLMLASAMLDHGAAAPPPRGAQAGAATDVVIEAFYMPDSELSTKALDLLGEMERQLPGLRVKTYNVVEDREALARLWKLAKRQGVEKPTAPAYYAYGQMKFGFRDPESTRRDIEELYTIHAFTREGCPHCRDAKAFLKQLQKRRPAIRVEIHDIVNEAGARDRMMELSRRFQTPATGLPCFYVCGRFLVGFQSAETTGRQLEALFRNEQPEKPHRESSRKTHRPSLLSTTMARGGRSSVASVCGVGLFAFQALSTSEGAPGGKPVPSESTPTESAPTSIDVPAPPSEGEPVPPPANVEGLESEESEQEDEQQIVLPLLGPIRVRDWGLPGFTFLVGLVDGFNPCAMWVLIFLLSVLVNIRDRKKIIVIAGTFVAISGLAYYSFMAAWLNIFVLIGWARPTQIVLGLLATAIGLVNVKDFVAFGRGVSFSIPESAKPGIYARVRKIVMAKYLTAALLGAAALAVLVNVIELLCTAGLPALYTQILMLQGLPAWKNYLYLALYIVAYMFDDTVMLVLAVVTLSHRRLQQSEGRWLKLVSGLVILALGLTMIFKPEWLE